MNDLQPLSDLLSAQTAHVSVPLLLVDFVLAAALGWLLGRAYARYGAGFSNRELFARNFLMIAVTTTLIITIVRSSLALSIGLAGALSIIRFRAAIKEPEELTYTFLAVALGVGLGAERTLITVGGFALILALLEVRHRLRGDGPSANFHLTITLPGEGGPGVAALVEVLESQASSVALQRFDESNEIVQAAFRARFAGVDRIEACSRKLRALGDGVRVSYVEHSDHGV